MSKYYLAYGSNLCVDRMAFRAPEAKIIGTGMLKGWRLLFREFATIQEKRKFKTPVLVWEISKNDEKKLDKYEGFPVMYSKKDFTLPVTALNGTDLGELKAMAYVMTPDFVNARNKCAVPFCEYFNLIDYGYKIFRFDQSILETALEESVQFFAL